MLTTLSVMGVPCGIVTITDVKRNEWMYANGPKLNRERRRAFTWVGGAAPPCHPEARQWEIVPHGDYVHIGNVRRNEWMYADGPRLKGESRHVLTCLGGAAPPRRAEARQWEIVLHGDYFRIRSVKRNEWMHAKYPKLDSERHHVLACVGGASPPCDAEASQWKIELCVSKVPGQHLAIVEQQQTIESLRQDVAEQQQAIEHLNRAGAEQRQVIESHDRERAAQRRSTERLDRERTERRQMAESRDQANGPRQQAIEHLGRELAERQRTIERLDREKPEQWQTIENHEQERVARQHAMEHFSQAKADQQRAIESLRLEMAEQQQTIKLLNWEDLNWEEMIGNHDREKAARQQKYAAFGLPRI